jgi:Fe-S oxidoreductase
MEIKNLEKWKKEMLVCIRCAYCLENCPVYNQIGWESAGARARMILSYGLLTKDIECSDSILEKFFQCTTCGQCEVNCPAKVKILEVIKATRKDLVENGHYFPPHKLMEEAVKKSGNVYGEEKKEKEIIQKGAEYTLFVGCVGTYREEESVNRTIKLLKKLEVSFTRFDELCCGGVFPYVGLENYQENVQHNKEEIKKTGTKKLLTICPMCYKTFKNNPEYSDLGFEVVHITQLLNKLNIKVKTDEIVTYHDPCDLGRHSGIYEEPREIIKKFAPHFVEMEKNRENARCCGAGGGVRGTFTKLSIDMAKDRLKEAIDKKADILLTECFSCLHNFKNAKKRKQNIKIYNISEYLSILMDGSEK